MVEPLHFVEDPGLDLPSLMAGQPILILDKEARAEAQCPRTFVPLEHKRSNPVAAREPLPKKWELSGPRPTRAGPISARRLAAYWVWIMDLLGLPT